MRVAILVPALLAPLATAEAADKLCYHSSPAPKDEKAKARHETKLDKAFEVNKRFAGAFTYLASDYIVCHHYAGMRDLDLD